jgi:hypothetical protein
MEALMPVVQRKRSISCRMACPDGGISCVDGNEVLEVDAKSECLNVYGNVYGVALHEH